MADTRNVESAETPILRVRKLDVFYGDTRAVKDVNFDVPQNTICAMIGPSGCGKTTILKAIARLFDVEEHREPVRAVGTIEYNGVDVYRDLNPTSVRELRRRVAYIGQHPNVFRLSIYENIAIGVRFWNPGVTRREVKEAVVRSLRTAGLWDDVADRLHKNALELSTGQRQRLCIARALALSPDVLLMDEPTAHLDPIAIGQIEENMDALKEGGMSILVVTHNMQQAARVSDRSIFIYLGEATEEGETTRIFTSPSDQRTQDYITGRFG